VFGVSGSESGGTTFLQFSRKLDTGDSIDVVINPESSMVFIFAIGQSDVLGYHAARGGALITLEDGGSAEEIDTTPVRIHHSLDRTLHKQLTLVSSA